MDSNNWQNDLLDRLLVNPENWLTLGDLFHEIEFNIPMHKALRGAATARRRNTEEEVRIEDLDLTKARWRFFIAHALRIVERQASDGSAPTRYCKYDDIVRLKPDGCCDSCGGPKYLCRLGGPGSRRAYTCPQCSSPKPIIPEPIIPEPEIIQQPIEAPEPVQAPQPIQVIYPAQLVPNKPTITIMNTKTAIKKTVQCLTLEESWREFADLIDDEIKNNKNLGKVLKRAFEYGALEEYEQILLLLEFGDINILNTLDIRAVAWAKSNLTPNRERRAKKYVCDAYKYGATIVVMFFRQGQGDLIMPEIDRLTLRYRPSVLTEPKKPGLIRRTVGRFLSPAKNNWRYKNW